MAGPYPIRPITAGEFPEFHDVDGHAFNSTRSSAEADDELRRLELDRTLAAWDSGRIVGEAAAYSLRMAVPGAVIPVAGVTWVSVLPTHRRRGILRDLMLRQLADIRDRGEAVAALFASEAVIYGRYGYGPASVWSNFTFTRGDGALRPDAPDDETLRLRIADPDAVRPELAKVHDAVLATRPGMFARDDAWWDHRLRYSERLGPDASPLRCVLAEDDAGPRGYGLYWGTYTWAGDGLADNELNIREVMAADPAACAAIWRDLLTRDLVSEVRAGNRPPDDPLLHLLADARRARARSWDGLWIRLVDVPRALRQRRYSCPVDVVIEVGDETCPWNAGRWRLRTRGGDPDGGRAGVAPSCERTGDPPDLQLPVRALGAAYLGGTRLGPLAEAGIVTERRSGAVAGLSAAMSWDPAPWCPMIF